MIIAIVACLCQGNRTFVFHHIRLKCVGLRILLCAVCARHDVHADAALTHHLLLTYFILCQKKLIFNEQFVTL